MEKELLSSGGFIGVAEQLGIGLFIMAKGASYRDAADKFQHSIATISHYFRGVLQAFVALSNEIIKSFQDLNEVSPKVAESSLYWPLFRAIDGTHINAIISDNDGVAFRGRKGSKTWNVMASCSFDSLITFVNVGFEGSASDVTVWNHCLSEAKFRFPHPPPGKYYLVDSGYPNTLGYLSPFKDKDVRYHMPDFKDGPAPQGMLENFNYRHSSLRTIIKRCFGSIKKRWKILRNMSCMALEYQLAIMVAAFNLHNFIRLHGLGKSVSEGINVKPSIDCDMFDKKRKEEMDKVQQKIAQEIWQSIKKQNDL